MLLVKRKMLPGAQLIRARGLYLVVEARNQDPAPSVLQLRDDMRERNERIGRRAAIHPGMKIDPGAARLDLGIDHAAQTDTKCRQLRREHLGVGYQREVGLEPVCMGAQELRKCLAAYLLLAFEDDPDVQGQLATRGRQQRLKRFQMHVHLALVVDRAAGIEVAAALGRLKGGREPLVERVRRLNIIVPVAKAGGRAVRMEPVSVHQRVPAGRRLDQLDMFHADAPEFGRERVCSRAHIFLVLGQRRHRGDAQQRLQLVDEALGVLAGIRNCCGHLISFMLQYRMPQYRGTDGSPSVDHASMPPLSDCTRSKPWLRSHTATFSERTPW